MWQQIRFDIRYAYMNLRRGGLWTLFAVFCIAAGVSAVVALRSLGLAIGDTLVSTVRESNNGDITLSRGGDSPFSAITQIDGVGADSESDRQATVFSEQHIADIRAYVNELGGEMTVYKSASGVQVAAAGATNVGRPQFVSVFLIDPTTYLPMGEVTTIDPPNTPLADLLTPGERVIVVSENLAEADNVGVGDEVRVSGTDEPFTVVGIAAAEEEAGLFDLIAAFFGFAYMHESMAETISVNPAPNRVSVIVPDGVDIEQAAEELDDIAPFRTETDNVVELEEQLGEVGDIIGRLIVITGLGALVIGGVGIINTMLVMVRRRTIEIATLKTFGVQGNQIASLFIWEALLLGLLGSIAGIVIGTLLGGFVNQFGEQFLQQSLAWRFYPQSAVYGLVLGMSVTVVFGVLPVLTAVQVRPAAVLRPNDAHIPAVGILQSIGVLFIIVLAIGTMVGSILGGEFTDRLWGDYLLGFGGTIAALVLIGVFLLILWVIVWLVSRLPAFGLVDLKLALRNMTSRRWRTATTLLALLAGMYALSSITFVSQSVRDVIRFSFSEGLGGNVLVFPLTTVFLSPDLAEPIINQRIDQLEGVNERTRNDFYTLEALELNGEPIDAETITFTDEAGEEQSFTESTFFTLARRSTAETLNSGNIVAGRDLTSEDNGANVIVIRQDAIAQGAVPLEVGQTLTVALTRFGGSQNSSATYEFEIVGLIAGGVGFGSFGQAFIPMGTIDERPGGSITTVDVQEEYLNEALVELNSLPTVLVLDISYIDNLIQRLIDQFSALPTVVGLLALLAAAAIMANTVLLATLERRKQIGVLKAIGLKSWRVLGVLLLENTIIALLGAGLGIGLSAFNSSILSWIGLGQAVPIPPNALPVALALTFAAVAIAWLATIASAGVIIRENVSTVLRYD